MTCLYRVQDFDEAVALANATDFGLTGAIHTSSVHRIEAFVARYRAGLVSINGATYGAGPHMPFGGVKNSGNGFREPGTEALDVYADWKTVVVNHDPRRAIGSRIGASSGCRGARSRRAIAACKRNGQSMHRRQMTR